MSEDCLDCLDGHCLDRADGRHRVGLEQHAKTKIVVLGSCKHAPYVVLLTPNPFDPKLYVEDHEKAYEDACKRFFPAIDEANVIFVYAPDGVGEHTQRDLDYARSKGKLIGVASKESVRLVDAQQQLGEANKNAREWEDKFWRCDAHGILLDHQRVELAERLQRIREHLEKLKEGMESTRTDISGLQVVNELLAVVEEGDEKMKECPNGSVYCHFIDDCCFAHSDCMHCEYRKREGAPHP